MEDFIHKENLALFNKRLAEPQTDAEREVLLKLLADEKAKESLPKHSILKPQWEPGHRKLKHSSTQAPRGPADTIIRTINAVTM